jgi:pimeloyl-ACP methyl ester carboxylesterase
MSRRIQFAKSPIVALAIYVLALFVSPLRAEAPDDRNTDKTQTAWLLHLPGIGGRMAIDSMLTNGLRDGHVNAQIEIYDWTGEDRGMAALTQSKRHRDQSKIVADMILKHVREHPQQPITLTSHSAGTGIAVWALEQLPDDVKVDDLVLIASALSPQYDLSKALRHVRNKAYAFNSDLDVLVLGAGTKMFGTVDRVYGDAAGRVGFTMPSGADEVQYKQLEQYPYDADWMRFRNNGEHIGPMMRPFASNVIARVLLGKGLPPRATTQPTTQSSSRPASQPAHNPR